MRAFNFRLQPVLDLKVQEKENMQQRYQSARDKWMGRYQDLESLENEKKDRLTSLEPQEGTVINPRAQEAKWNFVHHLNEEIKEVHRDVVKLEDIVNKRYKELLEKLKEEKSFEKLKENLAQKHRKEMERLQQKEVDEMGQQLYFKQIRGEG